jgi:zinc/manganese transport system permease protein
VVLVFSYLIVPAAIAGLFAKSVRRRLLLSWVLGVFTTALGISASWYWDLPTGPAIVAAFGMSIALTGIMFALRAFSLRLVGRALAVAACVAGLLLVLFPQMDQPWLDAVEWTAPIVHTMFLNEDDRKTRSDALDSIERGQAELAELRAREQDVRWGKLDIAAEKQERLRQYLAARGEIVAGDQLVLKDLRATARDNQRLKLGLPLVSLGTIGFWLLCTRRRMN